MVALATAFVRLAPQPDRAAFVREGQKMGDAAGTGAGRSFGAGFTRDAQGKLRQSTGKIAADTQRTLGNAGGAAGKTFGDTFHRDASGTLRQANGKIAADSQRALSGAGTVAGKGFGENFSKQGGGIIRRGMTSLSAGLGPLLIPLGIGAAVGAIGKIGMAYEDNLNIFQSVTKATGAQMAQISARARQLGADVTLPGVSAAGAAEAMTELAKAGFTVQQAMDGATGTLRLARAAGIGEAQAATIAANAVNAFGISAKDVTFVADELAAAANSSSVEVTDVANSFNMAAAVFSSFQGAAVGGKEAITELNTAVAILGNNGIRGSDAGTSLKQMMLQLTGPTQAAKDQMRLLAANAANANVPLALQGTILHGQGAVRRAAVAEMMKLNPQLKDAGDIAFDSAGKMRPLPQIIDLVTRGTKGMTQEERAFAITQIFGADASRSVIALMKGGLPTYEAQRKAVLQQGAAADVAAAKNKGLRGAIDNVRSQLENAAISIYTAVKGPLTAGLNGLANVLAPLAGQIASFAGFVSRNIGTIRDWAVAIGLVTLALKINSTMLAIQAAGSLGAWIKTLRPIIALTRSWAAAMAFLDATIISNPIGIVIVALAALAAGLVLAYRHSETFRNIVNATWSGIKTVVGAVASWFTGTLFPSIQTAIAQGAVAWGVLRGAVIAAWNGIKAPVSAVVSWFTGTLFPSIRTAIAQGAAAWSALRGAVLAAWNGLRAVVSTVGAAISAVMRGIGAVVTWLYQNIFAPYFRLIGGIVHAAWVVIQVAAAAIRYEFTFIGRVAQALYTTYILPVFRAIGAVVRALYTATVQPTVTLIRIAWNVMGVAIRAVWTGIILPVFRIFVGTAVSVGNTLHGWFTRISGWFSAMAAAIRGIWVSTILIVFRAFTSTAASVGNTLNGWFTRIRGWFSGMATGIRGVWTGTILPTFNALITGVRDRVAGAFRTAVGAITAAWNKVKEAARAPVAFVVNHVINPFVNGINNAAKFFGVTDRINPIGGFARGGVIPGYATGGRISGMPSTTDNRLAPANIPGVGAVKLAGGEFIVTAKDTAKALPILSWINDGMKGGPAQAAKRIGRTPVDAMGDGSQGWAFADGGLLGWVKNAWGTVKGLATKVWDIAADPAKLIKAPFEAAMKGIPGAGSIRDLLVGAGHRIVDWALKWITGVGGAGGPIGSGGYASALNFARSQAGKPYIWAASGPRGYDCSGFMSAILNVIRGDKNPYHRLFSTGDAGGVHLAGMTRNKMSPFRIGVWRSNPGHTAGTLNGVNVESRGSRGVVVGNAARGWNDHLFDFHYGLAHGGLVGDGIRLFDTGGAWPTGTLGANLSGKTEYVSTERDGRTVEFHAHFHGPVASERAAEDMVYGAWKRLKRDRKIT